MAQSYTPAAVNSVAFNLLFMQIVFRALEGKGEPVDEEAAFYRIEQLGFQVGNRLVERVLHFTKTLPFQDPIDVVKFLCKDYWSSIFGKAIDNLKTNHRGVYVLHDMSFGWVARFAVDSIQSETAKMTVLYLAFPCGLLRGALANLGIVATVTAEIPAFPQAIFQIRSTISTTQTTAASTETGASDSITTAQ